MIAEHPTLVTTMASTAMDIETQPEDFDPLWATIARQVVGKQRIFCLYSSFKSKRGKSLINHSYLSNAAIIFKRTAAAESSAFLILLSITMEWLLELRRRIMLDSSTT
jgi:hypothetical protein